jgi:uncharacterized membrane protein HdeD (DUF308 family)
MPLMENLKNIDSNKRFWWIPVISGLFLLLFGIWFMVAPLDSFQTLTIVFGILIFLSGILEIYIVLKDVGFSFDYLSYLWGGILNILLGILLIMNPQSILVIMSILISFWLIFKGGEMIKKALENKKRNTKNWKNRLAFGIIMILIAAILLWHPQIIGFTIAIWTSLAFIIIGVFRIYLGFKMRSFVRN